MSLICTTLATDNAEQLLARHRALVMHGCKLVEYRLDFLPTGVDVGMLVASRPGPIIATVRRPEDGGRWNRTEAERRDWLQAAITAGAEYVDLEPDAAAAIPRTSGTKRIVSLHDFQGLPDDLAATHGRLAACDADVVKLAVMAREVADNFRVLRLVASSRLPTTAFCMGDLGAASRILMARYGAPFTYAAESEEAAVAPGQIAFRTLRDLYRYESIGPATQFYCVIGDPIGHSKSPLIHNAALSALGLDGCYVPFRVPATELDRFLSAAREFGIRGVSITIPHKEASLTHATQLDPAAAAIGAVNTLVFTADGLTHGYNTDEPGAMESLEAALGEPLAGKRALVLGAGGAAKGIAYGLMRRGALTTVTNRNSNRGEELAAALGCCFVAWDDRCNIPYDVLINCTPLGMYPNVEDSPFPQVAFQPRAVVFDTVYNPAETRLLREAKEQGCRTVVGTEMFLRQAAWQFRYFTGHEAPLHVMRTALRDGHLPRIGPIVLIGYRGTGKTTVARLLAERLGYRWLDADVELEARAGKSIAQIFADDGEQAFRSLEAQVLAESLHGASRVIAAGGGVILRDDNRELLRRACSVVWLKASPETLFERIQADKTTSARRPNLTAAGGLAEVREMLARREPLYRECAKLQIDADRQPPETVVDAILAAWQLPGERMHA
ncbi:MAG: shikimate dehydrogenase [Pirellula sp.]|nr:shikimate dehydrogenase [Pirellula sp.]